MNREVHVRFWESPEVKVLRATRHFLTSVCAAGMPASLLITDVDSDIEHVR